MMPPIRLTEITIQEQIMLTRSKPGQLLILSYGLVDVIGTILLMLPWSSVQPTSFMQAWFTATSALTVTGLTVVPTSNHWTLFGQFVILLLMQIGGLGVMVFTTLFLILLGMKIQLGHRALIAQERNHFSLTGIIRLVRNVLILTLCIEGIGAVFMSFAIPEVWDQGWLRGLFFIIFHSVSAFNGAGFDLTGRSFIPYRDYLGFNLLVMVLILLGSLGYVVLQELFVSRRWRRLSLHSRLVLGVTGIVTILGSGFYLLTEFNQTLAGFPLLQKVVISFFQTVTRTAGFTTVPVFSWSEPFLFLMIIMMFIGSSPGSVGGGIKTTTVGVIVLAAFAIAKGKKEVVIFERQIAPESVVKAFTVTIFASILVSVSTLILMITEKLPLLNALFEVVSAFATAGLTMNVTHQLSSFGQVLICLLMFIGRIGFLSLIMALAGTKHKKVHYMKEEILIG